MPAAPTARRLPSFSPTSVAPPTAAAPDATPTVPRPGRAGARNRRHVDVREPVLRTRPVTAAAPPGARPCSSPCARRTRTPGTSGPARTMIRSRVTLASTLAAATHAATWSPFQTASPGTPSPSTGKPSVSTYSGRVASDGQRPAHGGQVAHVQPAGVHLGRRDDHHRRRPGPGGSPRRRPARGPAR